MFTQDFKNDTYTNAILNCTNEQHIQRALSGFELGARDALGISMASKSYPVSLKNEVPRHRMVVSRNSYNISNTSILDLL